MNLALFPSYTYLMLLLANEKTTIRTLRLMAMTMEMAANITTMTNDDPDNNGNEDKR